MSARPTDVSAWQSGAGERLSGPSARPTAPSALGRRRLAVVLGLVLAAALLAVLVQILAVSPRLSLDRIVGGLTGTDRGGRLILLTFRAPRLVVGALAGCALGVAGSLVQRLMRNPLASPDVLGVTAGASIAAMTAMLVLGMTGWRVSVAALLGGVVAGVLVLALAGGTGRAGARLVLIGVGLTGAINAAISTLATTVSSLEVSAALAWLSGSLAPASWERAGWLAAGCALLLPAVVARRRSLEVLEIDEDVAGALGSSPRRDTLLLLGLAVALVSLATAAAGPIAFVAFVSGPVSRLLLRGRASLLAAGATGTALTLLADGAAQLLPGGPFPVGIVTGAAGAPFLLWVLLRRSGKGASA